MSITVQLELPESVAKEARENGLLEPTRLANLIAREVCELDGKIFFQTARELRAHSGEPMSYGESQEEIDAVREEQRRDEGGH